VGFLLHVCGFLLHIWEIHIDIKPAEYVTKHMTFSLVLVDFKVTYDVARILGEQGVAEASIE
jgi:hypothetical protein